MEKYTWASNDTEETVFGEFIDCLLDGRRIKKISNTNYLEEVFESFFHYRVNNIKNTIIDMNNKYTKDCFRISLIKPITLKIEEINV